MYLTFRRSVYNNNIENHSPQDFQKEKIGLETGDRGSSEQFLWTCFLYIYKEKFFQVQYTPLFEMHQT